MILDGQLAIALEGHIGKAALAPGPPGQGTGFLKKNLLVMVVAGKNVVEPQGAVVEPFIKRLGTCSQAGNDD